MTRFRFLRILTATMYVFVFYAQSSTFTSASDGNQMVRQSLNAETDLIKLSPTNADGISVNRFNEFIVSTKKLKLFHNSIDNPDNPPAKVIIIEANDIQLTYDIELVGEPADILFINSNTGVSSQILCNSCAFHNFGRITLASGDIEQSFEDNIAQVGVISTIKNGIVTVNGLNAKGAQSLEIIAETVQATGTIDLNLRANKNNFGGYEISSSGSYIVGSGGVNIYLGTQSIKYEELTVIASAITDKKNDKALLNSKINAANISVISSRSVELGASAVLSTKSDVIASSVHNANFITPIEGIFIQTNRDGFANIELKGRIESDNLVQLVSLGSLLSTNLVTSDAILLVAQNKVENTGSFEAKKIEVDAKSIQNRGTINGLVTLFQAENTIYNHFGGEISGKEITLISLTGSVINGSRTDKLHAPEQLPALSLSATLSELNEYGIYYQVKDEIGNLQTNASANINGDTVKISAKRVENINPYYRKKAETENWDTGVDMNVAISRQVAINAETEMQIRAEEYVLNSSAIIGVNQQGKLVVNTPKYFNQRYALAASLGVFSKLIYNDIADGTGADTVNQGSLDAGIETNLTIYSPPSITYSFGKLLVSNLSETPLDDSAFVNQFSFLEVIGQAHFRDTDLHSVGLFMAARESVGFEPVKCALYGCSAAEYKSRIELETLTSFANNVYGLDSTLKVATINQLDTSAKGIVINDFVAEKIDFFASDKLSENIPDAEIYSYRSHSFVNDWGVNFNGNREELTITVWSCIEIAFRNRNGKERRCTTEDHIYSVATLLGGAASENNVNGAPYTPNEVISAAKEYLATLSTTGSMYLTDGSNVSGTYNKVFETWSNPNGDLSKIVIHYIKKFEPINRNSLSWEQDYYIYHQQEQMQLTVNADDLLSIEAPSTPTNIRLVSADPSSGQIKIAWNSVSDDNVYYKVNYADVGSTLEYSKQFTAPGVYNNSYRVAACNSVKCGEQSSSLQVKLVVPPGEEVLEQCREPFYSRITGSLKKQNVDTDGYLCDIREVNSVKVLTTVYWSQQQLGPGSPLYDACSQVRNYNLDLVVEAILAETALPSAQTQSNPQTGSECSSFLSGFAELEFN